MLTATAEAVRIRLRVLRSCFAALERTAEETSRLNEAYARYVEELQKNKWDVTEQLRQARLRMSRLQAELQSERTAFRRHRQRRQHRNSERRRSC